MTTFRYMSDLHLEFLDKSRIETGRNHPKVLRKNINDWWLFPSNKEVDADYTILAGDIHSNPVDTLKLASTLGKTIYVWGNHEYYRPKIDVSIQADLFREQIKDQNNVIFLNNEGIVLDGIAIYGGTFWTDLNLFGEAQKAWALKFGDRIINDYRGRYFGSYTDKFGEKKIPFMPQHTLQMHQEAITNLYKFRSQYPDLPFVVISHHAPHILSTHGDFYGDESNVFYASDLTYAMEALKVKVWVHGHMHSRYNYMVGDTNILANPRGYPRTAIGAGYGLDARPITGCENRMFMPDMTFGIKS